MDMNFFKRKTKETEEPKEEQVKQEQEMPVKVKKDGLSHLFQHFTNLRLSPIPFFINYIPRGQGLTGQHIREILKLIRPGDIVVRSHNYYLDSHLLSSTFQEAGFYLGEVNETHLKQIAQIEDPKKYTTGKQIIIHTTSQGHQLTDLLDFCRCDGLAIMRFPKQIKLIKGQEIPESVNNYFNELAQNKALEGTAKIEKGVLNLLLQDKAIEFSKLFKIFYTLALSELHQPHEFNFGFDNFQPFATSELIYFITKTICWNYDIAPHSKKILFKPYQVIEPDMFINANLEEVWKVVL